MMYFAFLSEGESVKSCRDPTEVVVVGESRTEVELGVDIDPPHVESVDRN